MVVSERAASADARGSGREGDMGDATLSTRRACGVHCCACAHGRTLRSGRRQSPRGRDTAEQHNCPWKPAEAGERASSYICERKMKVLCICSFLCFVCHRLRERLACMHRMRQLRTCMLRKSGADETPRFGSQAALQGDGPERWRNRLSRLRSHTSTWL